MKLKSIKKIKNSSKRYDIQTSSSNFFANSILVHNSLLISDHVNGQFNIRSRGTASAEVLDNSQDWMLLPQKYPKVKEFALANPDLTLLFEITTPNNKIVINYGDKVEFTLVGIINKSDYSLWTQGELDIYAKQLSVPRPKRYSFSNFEEMFRFCENNKEIEGFCVYWNNGQSIKKLKTDWYRTLHSTLANLGTFERVVDFYFSNGALGFQETIERMSTIVDFEVIEQITPSVSKICDYMKGVDNIVESIQNWVNENKHRTRKDIAVDIQQKWGAKTNMTGIAFAMLDDREVNAESRKKLLYQTMESNKIG